MKKKLIHADFCVVGGGMAGTCAAVAAARSGMKTVLIQDRPMLGGNASSEIRMWICGAHGENNHETGILEEILLKNLYRQGYPSYAIWDSVVWETARFQENLILVLNCSVNDADAEGSKIRSVTGWQMTTETWITVEAGLFADCSGDGILGPLTGAKFRIGREGRNEYGESIAPETNDTRTMGMSCLIQARETEVPQEFIPPDWAYIYDDDRMLPDRDHDLKGNQNFWWLEVGGMDDSIHDTEELRDELQKIACGVWDHIKNRGDHGADNWTLDWIGMLPGKRESRRFIGDVVITQNDIENEGRHFDDIVAFGGWTMDNHFPEGFYKMEAGTIFHPAPSPYGIPFRTLYSKNMANLFFAGRNISATHAAMSSTRVMATCAVMGEAVGTAAGLCGARDCLPRDLYKNHIRELQDTLQRNDCRIPWRQRKVSALTQEALVEAAGVDGPDRIRDGWDRNESGENHRVLFPKDTGINFLFESPREVGNVRIVFDSDMSRTTHNMVSRYAKDQPSFAPPSCLVKEFTVRIKIGSDWIILTEETNNYQRLRNIPVRQTVSGVNVQPGTTWGNESSGSGIFSIDIE